MSGLKRLIPKPSMPRRALYFSGGILALSVVYFMIIPLLALYLSAKLQSSPSEIGIVLAVLAISNQGSQVFVGALSDRWGTKTVLSLGIFIDCIGYLGFAAAPSFPFQLLSALALGLGTATVSLLGKVMLAEEASGDRASAFALRVAAINVGAAAGPVIGTLLFDSFSEALIMTAVVFALFWLVLVRPAPDRARENTTNSNVLGQIRALLRNQPLVIVTFASTGFWYLYTQLTFTFPLYANDLFGLGGKAGLLFALQAVVAAVLQYPGIAWFRKRCDSWQTIGVGCAVLSAGFLLLGIVAAEWALPAFAVMFALGSLLILPTLDLLATELSDAKAIAGTLGFLSLGWALGGLLGSLIGGYLYEEAKASSQFDLFWLANSVIGLATMVGFLLHRRHHNLKASIKSVP